MLDGDDFIFESGNGDVLDKLTPSMYAFFMKTVRNTILSPFSTWPLYSYHDNSTFNHKKTNLKVLTVIRKSFITILLQIHNASLNLTTLFVNKLLKAASGQ